MKSFDKTFWKFTAGFLIVIFVALAIFYFTTSQPFLKWLGQARIDRANREIAKFYASDIYGGETPQETFALFIDTLETGDTERASRFFVSAKQDEWLVKLNKMKSDGALPKQVESWKKARETFQEVKDDYNDWETHATIRYIGFLQKPITKKAPKGDGTFIQFTVPSGEYKSEIIFDLNKYSKIWKITLL